MRMLEKNSYITHKIQEERQVSFMCYTRESESKTIHFHSKRLTIWLKLGRSVIVYDLTKWVKPLLSNFFFLFLLSTGQV